MDRLIALKDALLEIFHIEKTQRPVQIKRWVFWVCLYGLGIQLKGLFVVS
jgi:hypothetical protein